MSMSDSISDMITRLRNAYSVAHKSCSVSYSSKLESVAKVLKKEGYIEDYAVDSKEGSPKKMLTMHLSYPGGKPAVSSITRVSRPSLRKYSPAKLLKKVIFGMGINIVSTSKGVISDREARALNVGGEVWIEVI
ncbi:MAG TPA: 30S ribosomal protein S8 [Gammaproteobacteria bacterium]|nr:30S ribosomal protein S8 [Gammaproteobacteria bacterium]